jgi:TPR repeat protein
MTTTIEIPGLAVSSERLSKSVRAYHERLYRRALAGDPDARSTVAFNIALIHWDRGGCSRQRAMRWFEEAARLGHKKASRFLATRDEQQLR